MQVFLELFCPGLAKVLHTDSYGILPYWEIVILFLSASSICYTKLIIHVISLKNKHALDIYTWFPLINDDFIALINVLLNFMPVGLKNGYFVS